MKRIINYTRNRNTYIFQEEGTSNKIEIDVNEKKLSGKDLYENFESARKVFDRADSVLEKRGQFLARRTAKTGKNARSGDKKEDVADRMR